MIQELQQAVDANAEALHEAASAGAGAHGPASAGHSLGEQISHNILHHISNGNTLEVPFLGEIDLPRFQVFGVDMSITRHVVMMWMAGIILLLLFGLAFRRRRLVPSGIATVLEIGVQFVHEEIAVKTLGEKDAKRLSPFLLTIFFFILTCNLLGLVPYCSTATGNINVTGSLALMALVMIQLEGIRKFGFIGHYKHLIPRGLPAYMFPLVILIFAIELFGFVVIKPFALMVRLFANMTAGHVAILALISIIFALQMMVASLFSIPFALFVYTLELLIALIQAYIFTILTSVFIGLQLHPSH